MIRRSFGVKMIRRSLGLSDISCPTGIPVEPVNVPLKPQTAPAMPTREIRSDTAPVSEATEPVIPASATLFDRFPAKLPTDPTDPTSAIPCALLSEPPSVPTALDLAASEILTDSEPESAFTAAASPASAMALLRLPLKLAEDLVDPDRAAAEPLDRIPVNPETTKLVPVKAMASASAP